MILPMSSGTPPPRIRTRLETKRLVIRAPLVADAPVLNRLVHESFAELQPWMPWAQKLPTLVQSRADLGGAVAQYRRGTDLRMLFFTKRSGVLIGSGGLHRIDWSLPCFEIGYWCGTRYVGRGYITEAVEEIARFALAELAAQRVEIRCEIENVPSRRVAERAGFPLEGIQRRDRRKMDGTITDTCVYARVAG